ncbi:MAG: cysteine hydrolase [bacterium]|nr:cysteine hydrolase [bacterium]
MAATKKKALLIIDMLNDFVNQGAPLEVPETRRVIPAIQEEIARARQEGYPVIYVCDSHEPNDREFKRFGWPAHAVRGSLGAEVIDELKPSADDFVVEKTTYSGFYNTRLDDLLKTLGVDTLRLTGCVTHICIMFTASDAVLRGYEVEVVKNGVAGLAPEDHEAALRIMSGVMGVAIV